MRRKSTRNLVRFSSQKHSQHVHNLYKKHTHQKKYHTSNTSCFFSLFDSPKGFNEEEKKILDIADLHTKPNVFFDQINRWYLYHQQPYTSAFKSMTELHKKINSAIKTENEPDQDLEKHLYNLTEAILKIKNQKNFSYELAETLSTKYKDSKNNLEETNRLLLLNILVTNLSCK